MEGELKIRINIEDFGNIYVRYIIKELNGVLTVVNTCTKNCKRNGISWGKYEGCVLFDAEYFFDEVSLKNNYPNCMMLYIKLKEERFNRPMEIRDESDILYIASKLMDTYNNTDIYISMCDFDPCPDPSAKLVCTREEYDKFGKNGFDDDKYESPTKEEVDIAYSIISTKRPTVKSARK